jgi:dienelactone hydrolase
MSGGGAGLMSGGGASMRSGTPGGRGTSGFRGCSIMPGVVQPAGRGRTAGAPRIAELMLGPLFHAWERYLASIAKDRKVRPFEWGLEWLSPNGREGAVNPEEHLQRWVADVMSDTRAFFHAPPTREYDFEPAPAGSHKGEAGTLRFPSAFVTPHPENNTVRARWFPAGSFSSAGRVPRPARGSGAGGGIGPARAVVVLPQWNSDRDAHIGLSRLLARCGISALRLSLPYHDDRMPPELTRADYIVSSNIARTVQVCRQAVLDSKRAIDWLALQGYDRIGMLGTSLGSCLAMLTTAHEPRIRAQALNHVSPWFADVVWRGLSTRHVRQGLDGHLELPHLRDLWRPISPFSYLDQVRHARTLLVYARYDLTFPVDLSRTLVQEFRERNLPHEVSVLPCGHYSTGVAPFKFLDGYVLTQFLRRNL